MPQSLAKVYLHPVFADEWRDELFEVMGGTANNLGCQSIIVGGMADRVHHAKQSFSDELRTWLRRYGVAWDERYVWD